jgi:hypothetical protein
MSSIEYRRVFREFPVFQFILGSGFAALGALFLYDGQPLGMLLFAAIGLGMLLLPSVVTVTADRGTRALEMKRRSALRHSSQAFSFEEISGISVQPVQGSKGRVSYRLVLKRQDGQLVPVWSGASFSSKRQERMAAQLCELIGVPTFDSSPAGIAFAALASCIDTPRETDGVHWRIQPVGSGRWHSPDFRRPDIFLCVAQKAQGQASDGVLASLGSLFFMKVLSDRFRPEETPGLEEAAPLGPLDPVLERDFMAYSGAPDAARQMLNSRVAAVLADWAERHPMRQLQQMPSCGQLTVLIGPGGVHLAPIGDFLKPDQVDELAALGSALVRSLADGYARE